MLSLESKLSNGHQHAIRQTRSLLARRVTYFSKTTFGKCGKFGKYHKRQIFWQMQYLASIPLMLGKCFESGKSQNKSKIKLFGEYSHSLNLLNLQHLTNNGKLIILYFVSIVLYATNKCRNLWKLVRKGFSLNFLGLPSTPSTDFYLHL